MFKLFYGEIKGSLMSGDIYFDHYINKSCLETEFAKRVIKEVSGADVFDRNVIIHPKYGSFPPSKLAGGIKSVLILMFDTRDKVVSLTAMGDNCLKYLSEIGKLRDFTVCTDSYRNVWADEPIYSLNSNKMLNSDMDVWNEFLEFNAVESLKYKDDDY